MLDRQQATDLVAEYLRRFATFDFGYATELFADDAEVEMPYVAPGVVHRGRAACAAYLDRSVKSFVRKVKFTIREVVFDAERQIIVVNHDNDGIRVDGREYHNHYIGFFHFVEGKIVRWTAFLNPSLL